MLVALYLVIAVVILFLIVALIQKAGTGKKWDETVVKDTNVVIGNVWPWLIGIGIAITILAKACNVFDK